MSNILTALEDPAQPEAIFKALEAEADALIGVKLFTLMTLDHEAQLARRMYSNMPDAYPVSGSKPMPENNWAGELIGKRQMFVGNTIDDLAKVFPDHPLILSLGCESCINIPVTIAGKVLGTINCLHDAGHYTPERVAAAEALKLPGALAFLTALTVKETS